MDGWDVHVQSLLLKCGKTLSQPLQIANYRHQVALDILKVVKSL